jgi:hypothetical protein
MVFEGMLGCSSDELRGLRSYPPEFRRDVPDLVSDVRTVGRSLMTWRSWGGRAAPDVVRNRSIRVVCRGLTSAEKSEWSEVRRLIAKLRTDRSSTSGPPDC